MGLSGVITCEDSVRGKMERNLVNGRLGGEFVSSGDSTVAKHWLGRGNSRLISGVLSSEERPIARAIPINVGTMEVHKVSVRKKKNDNIIPSVTHQQPNHSESRFKIIYD